MKIDDDMIQTAIVQLRVSLGHGIDCVMLTEEEAEYLITKAPFLLGAQLPSESVLCSLKKCSFALDALSESKLYTHSVKLVKKAKKNRGLTSTPRLLVPKKGDK